MLSRDGPAPSLFDPSLASRPFILQTNKVPYLIAGGSLLPRFLGEEEGFGAGDSVSQVWIASTLSSSLGEGREGQSRVAEAEGGAYLKDILEAAPASFLGGQHAARWGGNPGFLIKLLNSRDRLLVQVHPDKARASKYFDSAFGKTEAWYVVQASEGAMAHAGFKAGVTREVLREAILAEDSARILDMLHAFPIAAGDILFIPAGLPHALGSGSLVLEIQEPTDITLRAERRRPSGEVLPETFLHAGRGMDVLLDCFDYEGQEHGRAGRSIFLEAQSLEKEGAAGRNGLGGKGRVDGNRGSESSILSYETTPSFAMHSISLPRGASIEKSNDRFAVAIVLAGEGLILSSDSRIALRRGSEIFIPNGVRTYSYEGSGEESLEIIESYPPLADEGRGARA